MQAFLESRNRHMQNTGTGNLLWYIMRLIMTLYVYTTPTHTHTVKRYVRKGIPNEYRALIWMAASGSQEQMEKNPGYYHSLLQAQHDPKLVETIRTGWYDPHLMLRR